MRRVFCLNCPAVCVSVELYRVRLKGLIPHVCRWKEHLRVSAGDCGAAHKCTGGKTLVSSHMQPYFLPSQWLIWCARLYRTWPWSTQLPPTPLPSLQRNILIRILTWATETSAGPLNWAFEHRSKEGGSAARHTSYSLTERCEFSVWNDPFVVCSAIVFSVRFKGTLWMSEEHPLSLVEQVTPIIDLMARTSSHFARLRDFVTLKFPPGFPVKIGTQCGLYRRNTHRRRLKLYSHPPRVSFYIPSAGLSSLAEIPLFHVLNARITFGNVNKCSTEEEVNTTPAATPTSTGEDDEAAGRKAASLPTSVHHCVPKYLLFCEPRPVSLSPVQLSLHFKCVPQCSRCLPVTTVEVAADTRPCPTTTRSFCSTPSIRVSWSLAESPAK